MHIGYDISQTGKNKAGCGYFADAMLKAMFNFAPYINYSIYPNFGDFYFDSSMPFKNPYVYGKYGPRYFFRKKAQQFWKSNNLETKLNYPDILHANNFWCPQNLKSTRLIYTLYDISFTINPNWTTETNRQGCFEGILRASLYADGILAISESTRSDYLKLFPHFPANRIRVIYPSSRFGIVSFKSKKPKFLKQREVESDRFWLSVGTIEPRKNQKKLSQAYAHYCALSQNPMPLVFAGGQGWMMKDFQMFLKDLGIDKNVIFTGYVSNEELMWLYQNCYANLYPSLYEGFGLPVLEGMQFGAPTLASTSSSIPEITKKAALLLSPHKMESWAQAMLDLEKNPCARFQWKEKGFEQSKQFSWDKSASKLLEFYNDIVNMPKRT